MEHASSSGPASFAIITQWAARLEALGMLDKPRHEALVQALDDAQHGKLEQPPEPLLTVLLFGASGAGKSHLLNALAGAVIAPSHFLRPTTRIPTIYVHEAVQAERLFEYGDTVGHLTRLPTTFQRHQREELRHIVIIDAPDIDSHVPEHRAQVMQLLPAMDVVLYVVTPESYKNDRGWQTVLAERGRRAFAFVMNKWDREGKRAVPAGQTDVDNDFLALLQRGGYSDPLLFRVSAAYWVARHANPTRVDLTPAAGEQFPELQRWLLHELSAGRIDDIQRQRRRALWGSLAAAVAAAQPARLAEQPWKDEVARTLARLRTDGWQVLQPYIAPCARSLAYGYDVTAWPSSRGPFGLCLRGIAALRALVRQVGEVIPISLGSRGHPGRPPATLGLPLMDIDLTSDRLVPLIETRLEALEIQARQHGVPLSWLSERWRTLLAAVPARLGASVEQLATTFLSQPLRGVRMTLGKVLMVVLDLLLTAFLGLVVWRLGTTFVAAQYMAVGFVAHVLALFGSFVFLAYVALSWCFPQPEPLLRRQLETRLGTVWESAVAEMERIATDVLVEMAQLHRQGEQIMQGLNAAIHACSAARTDLLAERDPDTARLFAQPQS